MLAVKRWNPFEEMATFHQELEHAFSGRQVPASGRRAASDWSWIPAAEVSSSDDGWTIKMALPGIDSSAVKIELDDRLLTITGERTAPSDDSEKPRQTHLSEFGYGRFRRSFAVPDTVGGDDVTASFENGVLSLTLPVSEAAKPRQIAIAGVKAA